MLRTVSLYHYFPGTSSPSCTPCRLCQKLKRTFSRTVIIRIQRHICCQDSDQSHIRKIMPFYDHLCSNHNVCLFICKLRQNLLMSAFVLCGIHIHPKNPCLRKLALHYLFNLLCSCPETTDIRRTARWTILNCLCLITTVMTDHLTTSVYRQRHITVRTFYYISTGSARNKACVSSPVQE